MKTFKYKTSFSSEIKTLVGKDKDLLVSKASLEDLKSIIPDYLKNESNFTLLPIAASLCNANRANRNHAVIDGKTAKNIAKLFNSTQINLNHLRSSVIGHVVNTSFCSYSTENIIPESELNTDDIFNIAIAGVIYRVVDDELCDSLEEAAVPESKNYKKYSLSWELGFNEFKILRGSRNLSEGEIIDSESEIARLTPYLEYRKDDKGVDIYQYLCGDIIPLGLAVVINPAGFVKGITVLDDNDKKENEEEDDKEDEKEEEPKDKNEDVEESKSSLVVAEVRTENQKCVIPPIDNNLTNNLNSTQITKTYMKLTKIEDLTDENLKVATAASVIELNQKLISDAVEAADAKWKNDIKVKEEAAANAFKEIETLKQKLAEAGKEAGTTQEQVEQLKADLTKVNDILKQQESEAKLNERMAGLKEKYTLEEDLESIVASEITGLDDAAFAAWTKKAAVIYKGKEKVVVASVATASVKEVVAAAAATAVAAPVTVVNPAPSVNDLKSKWAGAFTSETVKVTKHKSEKH